MIWSKSHVNKAGLLCLLFLIASPVFAWSGYWHSRLFDNAVGALPETQQAFYASFFSSLNVKGKAANVATLADHIKSKPINAVFSEFNVNPVNTLSTLGLNNSKDWHYQNSQYFGQCGNAKKQLENGKLLQILTANHELLFSPQLDSHQAALILALQIHLIQDYFQPMHRVSRWLPNCKSDRGGNLTCIEFRGQACAMNLHHYWDRGLNLKIDNDLISNTKVPVLPVLFWLEAQAFSADLYTITDQKSYQRHFKPALLKQLKLSQQAVYQYLHAYYDYKTKQ